MGQQPISASLTLGLHAHTEALGFLHMFWRSELGSLHFPEGVSLTQPSPQLQFSLLFSLMQVLKQRFCPLSLWDQPSTYTPPRGQLGSPDPKFGFLEGLLAQANRQRQAALQLPSPIPSNPIQCMAGMFSGLGYRNQTWADASLRA